MELNAVDFIKTLGVTFAALFPIVNPLGCAPIFFGLTRNYPQSAQRVLAHKIAAYGFVLLIVSSLFGSEILAFFGISLFVVQIAGGLVVAITGWNLLNQPADDSSQKVQPGTLEDALQHAFFPLTLPLTVGPGGISVAITLGAHLRYQAGPGFEHGIHVILSRRLAACFSSVFSSWFAMAMLRGWCGCWANQAQAF